MAEQLFNLKTKAESIYKERGSRFLSFAFPVSSLEEVRGQLHQLKELYPDATHHCYAYVLEDPSNSTGFSDDGEPSNSAGRPILRQILSRKLRHTHVVVVRYFGGSKLGVPGLIESYGEAAAQALDKAGITEYIPSETWQISCDYANENLAYRFIRQHGGNVLGRSVGAECTIVFSIAVEKLQNLKELCSEIANFDMIRIK